MSVRVVRASLRRMWETWVCTVWREITSSAVRVDDDGRLLGVVTYDELGKALAEGSAS